MEVYDFVFVILVYRNTNDLENFFKNFNIDNSKVIVINSFYDDYSEKIFKDIASKYNADFISVENKGYGAGNNAGCRWALNHYSFKYLIISNADIEIKQMTIEFVKNNVVNAPEILNGIGRSSNPMQPYDIPSFEEIKYRSFKTGKNSWRIKACISANKLLRSYYRITHPKGGYIYMCHGAFLILPYEIVSKLTPIYNEQQFLFCEEDHLAHLLKENGFKTYYNPNILIHHKEDGSVGVINEKVLDLTSRSYITFYEHWNKK